MTSRIIFLILIVDFVFQSSLWYTISEYMDFVPKHIALLVYQSLSEGLSPEDDLVLQQWLNSSERNRSFFEQISREGLSGADLQAQSPASIQHLRQQLYNTITGQLGIVSIGDLPKENREIIPVIPRVAFYRAAWFRYAAIIVLVLGSAAYLWLTPGFLHPLPTVPLAITNKDISPGCNRAVLTIDNKQIDLDSAKTGISVGSTITYADGEVVADAGQLLLLTTPKGGQYQAVLPDGSKVWLNAASSIKFPSKFSGNTRDVIITGEVYMEVAPNLKNPFSVMANGAKIDVLGTSFNVNSYENENAINITLLEGAVRANAYEHSQTLKPGQQAKIYAQGPIKLIDNVDIKQVMAWKNGYFDFNNADLPVVMRQIERWYNIEVTYEGNIPDVIFKGKMDRNVLLSDVILFLRNFGIKANLRGRNLIISGS